jgi:hypothetical protein
MALVPLTLAGALGSSTGYAHAVYMLTVNEPSITIAFFALFAGAAYDCSEPFNIIFSNSHYTGVISRNKATMSITSSADLISQGTSIYERLISAVSSDKARRIASLIGASFRLLGNQDVRDLLGNRVLYTAFMHYVFLMAVTSLFYQFHAGYGFLLLLCFIVLLPYAFFFHIKKRACICYLTYAQITLHKATIADSKNVARQQKWNLRLFGFVELALSRANSAIGQSTGYGVFHFLVAGVMAILEGAFEVAESYLLPTLMIENISLKPAAEKLKSLKSHVPEVLAGTFGLDIFGGVASAMLSFVYSAIILVSALLAYFLPKLVPTLPCAVLLSYNIFVFPMIFAVVLISFMKRVIRIIVTSMQATYFSVFYTLINKPSELSPEMKQKVVEYLKA